MKNKLKTTFEIAKSYGMCSYKDGEDECLYNKYPINEAMEEYARQMVIEVGIMLKVCLTTKLIMKKNDEVSAWLEGVFDGINNQLK